MEVDLDTLVDTVLNSAKYREVSPTLVRAIGAQELRKRRNQKEAVKATKNKLHQTVGAYWQGNQEYADWLAQLTAAAADPTQVRTVCQSILRHHASTRERLPLLPDFYATLFAGLPPIHSVLDLACGLNPLTIPWMPLAADAVYQACDIAHDQAAFLHEALPLLGVQGSATVCNLLETIPAIKADVVLLLKTLPCLEQVDPTIGARLLTTIDAPVLIVSFPGQSLGGRHKGMTTTYPAHLQALLQDTAWQVTPFPFATELVFRLVR
jgi:16S rRNA (guanine(1405)-N(7))-methyltransferase